MNYTEMKDHEINAAVGEAIGWNAKFIHLDDSVTFRDYLGRLRGRKNYCNSWADAGPIIAENKIALIWYEVDRAWDASANYKMEYDCWGWGWEKSPEHYTQDANPLRAAMIVFLMMQEAK